MQATRLSNDIAHLSKLIDDYVDRFSPFTPILGVSRSLIALATASTLIFTPTSILFYRSENYPSGTTCSGFQDKINIICIASSDQNGVPSWIKFLLIFLFLVVASGYRPRYTGIIHWYLTFSFVSVTPIPDGGDHLSLTATLLLMFISLCDSRKWHWSIDGIYRSRSKTVKYFAYSILALMTIQIVVLYFQAAIAKLGVREWATGEALWYWMQNSTFSPPDIFQGVIMNFLSVPLISVLITYSLLLFQSLFAFAPLSRSYTWRKVMLHFAVIFHAMTALLMGLWSFALIMVAVDLVVFIRPHEVNPYISKSKFYRRLK